jgi:hypothetical protein
LQPIEDALSVRSAAGSCSVNWSAESHGRRVWRRAIGAVRQGAEIVEDALNSPAAGPETPKCVRSENRAASVGATGRRGANIDYLAAIARGR